MAKYELSTYWSEINLGWVYSGRTTQVFDSEQEARNQMMHFLDVEKEIISPKPDAILCVVVNKPNCLSWTSSEDGTHVIHKYHTIQKVI